MDRRQRSAAHCDRHRMEPGLAGFKVYRTILLIVMRCGSMMLVRGQSVVVLRMVVIRVQVDVQRRDLAGGRGQDQSEEERDRTVHKTECMQRRWQGQTGGRGFGDGARPGGVLFAARVQSRRGGHVSAPTDPLAYASATERTRRAAAGSRDFRRCRCRPRQQHESGTPTAP
jgi:hypothetical protein